MENRITLSKRVEGKSRLWVTLLLLCFCSFTWAQVKVTGVVTDPSGEAIIGANIVEKVYRETARSATSTETLP